MKTNVQAWLNEANIDCRTISLCVQGPDDECPGESANDPEFGTCDISNKRGDVWYCMACFKESDEVVFFQAGDWLIGGELGRIAGAI